MALVVALGCSRSLARVHSRASACVLCVPMRTASRETALRSDFGPQETRLCGALAASPMFAMCAGKLGANGPRRGGAESGVVLPPPGHPFWRGADVAHQTAALFGSLSDERDAAASELATTLVRLAFAASEERLAE